MAWACSSGETRWWRSCAFTPRKKQKRESSDEKKKKEAERIGTMLRLLSDRNTSLHFMNCITLLCIENKVRNTRTGFLFDTE